MCVVLRRSLYLVMSYHIVVLVTQLVLKGTLYLIRNDFCKG